MAISVNFLCSLCRGLKSSLPVSSLCFIFAAEEFEEMD